MGEISMQRAALDLANRGFKIFPCVTRGKNPLTMHGCKDATDDPDQVAEWWHRWPGANIGIATGGGLVVVDVDCKDGKDGTGSLEEWQRVHGGFPDTLISRTGSGGFHLFYEVEDSSTIKNAVEIIGGVDIRSDGGYVIAPPSIHESGRRHEWVTDGIDVAFANDSVMKLLHNKKQSSIQRIRPGEMIRRNRNNTLYFMARRLQDLGLLDETIIAAVMNENEHHCLSPLPEREIMNTIKSALNNEKGEIRRKSKRERRMEFDLRMLEENEWNNMTEFCSD